MRMMMLAVLSLALAAVLVAGETSLPVEGGNRYPNIKAQQTWEQMGRRWEAAALSVYGTLRDVTKMVSQAFPKTSLTVTLRPQVLKGATTSAPSADVAARVAQVRVATAKYVTNLELAKADGYQIITPMIPNMGYHFLNPTIEGFDLARPPILVYVRSGKGWQLVAVEWVFPTKPATAPLRGARYGSFGAACHYADGSFVMADAEAKCAKSNPKTGAAFGFWHPPLITLHLWIWYPNPEGVFGEFNPLLTPFNNE